MTNSALPRLQLLAAAVLFSTGGAVVKEVGLDAWQVSSYRSAIAAATLLALIPGARKLRDRSTWLVGAAFAATVILYVQGNKLTTAANTIFLQSTAPIYLGLLSPWILKERSTRLDVALMGSLLAGLVCFFVGQPTSTEIATNPRLGNILAATAGATWALTLLGLRWLERDGASRSSSAVAAGSLIAAIVTLPFALSSPVSVTPIDVGAVVYLGMVQIGLAYLFLVRGIARVPVLEASLLLLVEPVLNPLWAWLAHDEIPSRPALVGCAIILTATAGHAIARSQLDRSSRRIVQQRD